MNLSVVKQLVNSYSVVKKQGLLKWKNSTMRPPLGSKKVKGKETPVPVNAVLIGVMIRAASKERMSSKQAKTRKKS
jgi:hypothetical protein